MAAKRHQPVTFLFADDGAIPNNPSLALVLYRDAVALPSEGAEAAMERVLAGNAWGDMWRNGIYPYVHYHSMTHEALGIARGRARARFGGESGEEIDLRAGDVAILPAGTGHQCLWASPNLMVIGAYPRTGRYDLCRGSKAERTRALRTIPRVPLPETDPVYGADGPLAKLWRR
jgi:uncharacterized protein YjlB